MSIAEMGRGERVRGGGGTEEWRTKTEKKKKENKF
jgi:hypothetical protein